MSGDGTSLGDRMKLYEAETRFSIEPDHYTILRIDGRAFHTYLKGAPKPFDYQFADDMTWMTRHLCKEISGTTFAYGQSDEVSFLIQNLKEETEFWFGGNLQKLTSVTASTASSLLTARRGWSGEFRPIAFDARVFSLPTLEEVNNYFMWRQRDALRNSVQMAAQANFSHRELQGLNTTFLRLKLLNERGIEWTEYPVGVRQGYLTKKVYGEKETEYQDRDGVTRSAAAARSWWETEGAPLFVPEYGSYIMRNVPVSLAEMGGTRGEEATSI